MSDAIAFARAALSRMGPEITNLDGDALCDRLVPIKGDDSDALKRLGINLVASRRPRIFVTSTERPVGQVAIETAWEDSTFIFDNDGEEKLAVHGKFRLRGRRGLVVFPKMKSGAIQLSEVFLRADDQMFFWGSGSTCVEAKFEIEGANRRILVGDDCLLSAGIWMRNYDMHTLIDLETNEIANSAPRDILLEQHVWIGQHSFLLNPSRIGFGSIIGTHSLVLEEVPNRTLIVGSPARVLRKNVSWDRQTRGIAEATLRRLQRLAALERRPD